MEKCLNDGEIIEVVIEYIDNAIYNYAVMIDGEWGSGKTYFVKNNLVSAIEQHENEKVEKNYLYTPRKVLYISLYGISSTEEISNEIYMSLYKAIGSNQVSDVRYGVKVVTDIAKSRWDANYDEFINNFSNFEEYIFILDDLERCNCHINEIFGYINDLVENQGLKTIIVSNQKEIGKFVDAENLGLKYLLSASANVDFGELSEEFASQDGDDKISITEIKRRTQLLCDDDNQAYQKVKEKLVGITIKYEPDYKKVTKEMIRENVSNPDLQNMLLDLNEQHCAFAIEREHTNLRTFQFFISKIIVLYESIKWLKDRKTKLLKDMINYSFCIAVAYKQGTYEWKWTENNMYIEMDSFEKASECGYQIAFRFIDEFMIYSKCSQDEIDNEIKYYLSKEYEKEQDMNNPIIALDNWWQKDETKIRRAISDIMAGLQVNKFAVKIYPSIIYRMVILCDVGFETDLLMEIIKQMIINIKETNTSPIELDEGNISFDNENLKDDYEVAIKPIRNLIDEKNKSNKQNFINELLGDVETWGHKIYDYVKENRHDIATDRISFISELDVDKILSIIKATDNGNVYDFRKALYDAYKATGNKANERDLPNLKALFEGLKSDSCEGYDLIKMRNMVTLVQFLGMVIKAEESRS
ncbi:MAG: hypothetical protein GX225_06620 [Clostridiales bacterium]|nr:hypothetical protein [Clostridiales bacterium]